MRGDGATMPKPGVAVVSIVLVDALWSPAVPRASPRAGAGGGCARRGLQRLQNRAHQTPSESLYVIPPRDSPDAAALLLKPLVGPCWRSRRPAHWPRSAGTVARKVVQLVVEGRSRRRWRAP